jgi:hypothetical protein
MCWPTTIRFGVALLVLSSLLSTAVGQEIEEYQVKAAYLYNFAKFVEWPAQSFPSSASPIVICILGEDPFAGSLQEAVRGKTASGRTLVVRPAADLPAAKACQILFVGFAEWRRSRLTLGSLAGNGVLTVGESPNFSASGGIINFKLDAGRVRFQINVAAARQAPVQISSKLLSLADIVNTQE